MKLELRKRFFMGMPDLAYYAIMLKHEEHTYVLLESHDRNKKMMAAIKNFLLKHPELFENEYKS